MLPRTPLAKVRPKTKARVERKGRERRMAYMLAANCVSPRAVQALMRHTDPLLTANVYTDEKLLPLAAELQNVPAIPLTRKGASIALLATGTEG